MIDASDCLLNRPGRLCAGLAAQSRAALQVFLSAYCWRLRVRISIQVSWGNLQKRNHSFPPHCYHLMWKEVEKGERKGSLSSGPLHPLLPNELMQQHHHLSNWLQPWSSPDFLQIPTGRKPFFLSVFSRNSWQAWHSYSWKCSIGHLLEESADWWNWTDLVLHAVQRSLPLSRRLGTCLCSVPRPPSASASPHTGFSSTPACVQPALHQSSHGIQGAGNCIFLLAALPWLSCAAITVAAWRQISPDHKLQSCPLCTQALVPWKSCAHTETGMCVWQLGTWGHGLSNCATPACL